MARPGINLSDVSFTYDSASESLIHGLTVHFPVGWTGIVGANGTGKTTLLKLATGELRPRAGKVVICGDAIYCEQRTDAPPPMFEKLLLAGDPSAYRIRGRLGIGGDWFRRWNTLSHGERKRAQMGVLLWRDPAVLAVDEPTNHLDIEARDMLARSLRAYQGVGLLVSHDRDLLDSLCEQCLFLSPPSATMRPGGFTKGRKEGEREEETVRREYAVAKQARKRLEREAIRRRALASQADRKRSKRGISLRDHDAKEKIDRARVTSQDAARGRLHRQLKGRLEQSRDKQASIKVKKNYEMGIWLPSSRSKGDTLFRLSACSISLGYDRGLSVPDLAMRPSDRIALTGANGSGKSTLLSQIVASVSVPPARLVYVPQEIDLEESQAILDRAKGLPNEKLGLMMAVVSRLGSRPERLLASRSPSPGETRKLLLALGISTTPHLIIMDEPTNHMDLPSIECLEEALEDCPCGLLLVSHDLRFLKRLTRRRWHIREKLDDPGKFALIDHGWMESCQGE